MQLHRTRAALLFLALGAILAAPAAPQTPSGVLRGAVQDTSGARIVEADVSISDVEKSYSRESHSDDRGEFRVTDVPPGTYDVAVTAKGFAEARAKVTVAVCSVRDIVITLQPAS